MINEDFAGSQLEPAGIHAETTEAMKAEELTKKYQGYTELLKTYKKQKREAEKEARSEQMIELEKAKKDLNAQLKQLKEDRDERLSDDKDFQEIMSNISDAEIDVAGTKNDLLNLAESVQESTGKNSFKSGALFSEEKKKLTVYVDGKEI